MDSSSGGRRRLLRFLLARPARSRRPAPSALPPAATVKRRSCGGPSSPTSWYSTCAPVARRQFLQAALGVDAVVQRVVDTILERGQDDGRDGRVAVRPESRRRSRSRRGGERVALLDETARRSRGGPNLRPPRARPWPPRAPARARPARRRRDSPIAARTRVSSPSARSGWRSKIGLGDDQGQHAVAEELEPLEQLRVRPRERRMRQRLDAQFVGELIEQGGHGMQMLPARAVTAGSDSLPHAGGQPPEKTNGPRSSDRSP